MKRGWILLVGVLVAVFALAAPASAHVTVTAPGATEGGSDQLITFRVPNESAKATTTQVQVSFPTDTPIASVLPQPVAGWTITTTTTKLAKAITTDDGEVTEAVSLVTWKAKTPADGIPVGQFQQFDVIAGQLPKTPTLTFPAIQTYSDGTVTKWIETPAPGSTAEPDHPAPVLTLSASASASAASRGTSSSASDTGAVVLAVIALVVAAAALGFGVVSRAKTGRRE
jgi:uncharacterized protein